VAKDKPYRCVCLVEELEACEGRLRRTIRRTSTTPWSASSSQIVSAARLAISGQCSSTFLALSLACFWHVTFILPAIVFVFRSTVDWYSLIVLISRGLSRGFFYFLRGPYKACYSPINYEGSKVKLALPQQCFLGK
jgi:hypothetical protein